MKIRGNTVGTTMPRADYAQKNPKKADFIKNKPAPFVVSHKKPEGPATWFNQKEDIDQPTGDEHIMAVDLNMGQNRLFGLPTPVDDDEAVTKRFVTETVDPVEDSVRSVAENVVKVAKKVDALADTVSSLHSEAGAILETASGEVITVSDASDLPLAGLKVFGKTEQITTTGKNLLQNTATGRKVNNVEFTVNSDGSILAQGEALENTVFVFNASCKLPAGTYIYSGCPAGGGGNTFILTSNLSTHDTGKGVPVTLTEETDIINSRIYIIKGTVMNHVFRPMIRLASITDDTYEPYTGGIPSPNPEYPQELESVGDVAVTVVGKNYIDLLNTLFSYGIKDELKELTSNSITFEGKTNKTWQNCGYRMFLPDGRYTFSAKMETNNGYLNLSLYNSAELNGSFTYLTRLTAPGTVSFTVAGNNYIDVRPHFTGNDGTGGETWTTKYYDIQIERGNVATDFQNGDTQFLAISTDLGLPGIPVESDSTGQQWICDEVDFEKGVYVQRVNTRVFNGTEDWKRMYNNGRFGLSENWGTGNVSAIKTAGISTHYNWNQSVDVEDKAFRFAGTADYTKVLYLADYDLKINASDWVNNTTAVEIKEFLAEQYAKGTPVTIKYILTEEKHIPLSPDQLAAFAQLHSNYPNTTVFNDKDAGMEVKYVADTKLYIDKKFNELAAALVSNV